MTRARYLLRFDDICSRMNWRVWRQVEAILIEYGVKPILAVVPDNRDPELDVGDCAEDFWARVRRWQARGWTIGLHGHRHVFRTRDAGLLGLHARSEFAGLPPEEQFREIETAAAIFRRQSVQATVWIAPAHSFDAVTIRAIKAVGIPTISDGFHLFPFRDADGVVWVPQQLWSWKWRPAGIWTICHHINGWTDKDVIKFQRAVRSHRSNIACFAAVVRQYEQRRSGPMDALFAQAYRRAAEMKSRIAYRAD